MENLEYFNKFYIDKEKDIVVELYKDGTPDELTYIIRTPNHKSGNLIKNLAKLSGLETIDDKNGLKIIRNTIPASINGDNEEVYIFRLGGMKIANIYENRIEVKAKMPAISKILMSQTKNYTLDIKKTIVKSYIFKKSKFKTDLHTHMNANLSPDILIALGIVYQVKYPLYYIKKLDLKITDKQAKMLSKQRKKVEKDFESSELTGKYLVRKIDDNTFINFADLILNNIENSVDNISKIRSSLALLKDGQSVFTNLEKIYIYRYVFCKAKFSESKIKVTSKNVEKIPEQDIVKYLKKILEDKKAGSIYENNTLRQDKYLWIAREYQKQSISYVEITDTDLAKTGEPAIKLLEEVHEIMPKIEKETGVAIRLLVGIRRIPLTIIKDQKTSENYLRENLDVLKAVAKSPYVVGSDFIGEEINDITELKPVINELVQFTSEDEGFTIRIHAGENDSLRENVAKSIACIKESLKPGQKMPKFRLGHGLYTADLTSEAGKELIKEMQETGAILEFQLTSNIRLNNLTDLERHPLKQYLKNGIKCVQGTDGCGMYGTDTMDEQLALHNILGLNDTDFQKMRKVEDEIIEDRTNYFNEKTKKFEEFLAGRTIREAILQLEKENFEKSKNIKISMRIRNALDSEIELKDKIKKLPEDKMPIIIAGGSFNAQNRETVLDEAGKAVIKKLVENLDDEKVYFVVGHKMSGYEKAVIDYTKKLNKKFEVNAIIPKKVSEEVKDNLLKEKELNGVCISTESEEMGIYKSFNYEIFERRSSIVLAFDGNSPVSNLVLEAKNGKGNAKIYVNSDVEALKDKANALGGYVKEFKTNDDIAEEILRDYPEIGTNKLA